MIVVCGLSIVAAIIGAYEMQRLGSGHLLAQAAPICVAGMIGGIGVLLVCSMNHPMLRRGIHLLAVASIGSLAALLFVRWIHLFREVEVPLMVLTPP